MGAGHTLINSIEPWHGLPGKLPTFPVNSKKDEIFFGHQACRRNLAALFFGPCRIGCSSFERTAE